MKRILTNKKFITVITAIATFLIMTGIFCAISQCIYEISKGISGNINISIGVNGG